MWYDAIGVFFVWPSVLRCLRYWFCFVFRVRSVFVSLILVSWVLGDRCVVMMVVIEFDRVWRVLAVLR